MSGTDTTSIAYCRACGKALTADQQRNAQGTVFCEEHVPKPETDAGTPLPQPPPPSPNDSGASPWTAPPTQTANQARVTGASSGSPGLAFLLGLIPGVGAIYNGQYAKGLLHVVVMGMLASVANAGDLGGLEAMIVMLLIVFPFYMAFEAYHTAQRKERGLPVDEFSSILPLHGDGSHALPLAPIGLIVTGVLFLLHNLEILRISRLMRFWPVLLIVLGIFMLYSRLAAPSAEGEGRHE